MLDPLPTTIPGCYRFRAQVHHDIRGAFLKTFPRPSATELPFTLPLAEEYITVSKKRVLRGIHFQGPPHDLEKLVQCASGTVLDAVVDLRLGSPTFGMHELFELSGDRGDMLFMPRGIGHAFYVLSKSAVLIYKVSKVYCQEHDHGIHWASIGIPWPDSKPILSPRDRAFPALSEFQTPFSYADR